MGTIERSNPDLLDISSLIEEGISSTPSPVILGIFSVVEMVGHCIPVVYELMDSDVTFIVPIISLIESLSTFGVYMEININKSEDIQSRRLFLDVVVSGFILILQASILIPGVGLALRMHLFKMLLQLTREAWLTQILTIMELFYCITTILLVIYIRPVALITASFILFG